MSATQQCSCKVSRVGQQYGIEDLDERLLAKREEGTSLRGLERYLGRLMLRRVMTEAGVEYVEGSVERFYDVLTSDTSSITTEQVRQKLRSADIDVESVLADVPSYQTIRHHLNHCLDVDTSGKKGRTPVPSQIKGTIRALATRTERVTEKEINRLRQHNVRAIGPVDVHVNVNVTCSDCGNAYSVYDMIDAGCACSG